MENDIALQRYREMGFDGDGLPPAGFRGTQDKLPFGPWMIAAESEQKVVVIAEREFRAVWLCVPFVVHSLEVFQIECANEALLIPGARPPIELFSVASTFPALVWPTFAAGGQVTFSISNRGNTPRQLSGAFYGNYTT